MADIVIGAGLNGLTAALELARNGRQVVVVERRSLTGGTAAGEMFHDGYTHAGTLTDDLLIRAELVKRLQLDQYGAALRDRPAARWIAGRDGGLVVDGDVRTGEQLTDQGRDQWLQYRRFVGQIAPILRRLMDSPPPDILNTDALRTQLQVVRSAVSVRALGRTDMFELLRALPMAVRDFTDDMLDNEALKAAIEGPALLGTWAGPWSPGTTTNLLLREATCGPGVVGGPAAVARALAGACDAAGVTIACDEAAAGIEFDAGAVSGVRLQSGELVAADRVVSSLDPKTTLLSLVRPADLPLRLTEQVRAFRTRGIVAVLHLALDRQVSWDARPGERFLRVQVGESHVDLERAFDAAKYLDGPPASPWLDVYVPTVETPGLAPNGCDVVTVMATGVRYQDGERARDEQHLDGIYDAILAALGHHCEEIHEAVVGYQLLTPSTLHDKFGLAGGHLWHGEPALDQLLSFRPAPSCAAGRTPLPGLFLCGGGIHPGGGHTLVPGHLGAQAALVTL